MTDSLRTEPRRIRAARRATLPVVKSRRPAAGRHHPASAEDVRVVLTSLGSDAYYGVDLIELRPAPRDGSRLQFGAVVAPGTIAIFDQPESPWRLGNELRASDARRLRAVVAPGTIAIFDQPESLRAAGALIEERGVVVWPPGTLRNFILQYVLTHELGHHILQHERRLRGAAGARVIDA